MNTDINILVVDDEENVRQLLQKLLSHEGYTVDTARDGMEGLHIIGEKQVDIIISDIKMPHMSGIEFLNKVKKIDPQVGFILITAFATMETAIEALRSGAQDYITKPFDIEDILAVVRQLTLQIAEGNALIPCNSESHNDLEVQSKNEKMKEIMQIGRQVADAESTVLITGETGTGKEVMASAIHNWSSRKNGPIIKVNCAAIPDNLLESELFGYEKGAFTGAVNTKPGKFEIAQGGTIFLDEIGDISPALQIKLLRVLQDKGFERLGGLRHISVDVRVIAATNKDLMTEITNGLFRKDLYYRLNVVPIHLPPLRERQEDIEDLVAHFLQKSAKVSKGRRGKSISGEALELLKSYSWPGNIRELENIIERCVVITPGTVIEKEHLPAEIQFYDKNFSSDQVSTGHTRLSYAVDDLEKEIILQAIADHNGNKTKAADSLGISRRSLHRKLQKYSDPT